MNAMRRVLSAGLVLAASVAALAIPTSARAEMWCIRDFGSDRPVCVFPSARDCTSAAVIRGGICEREQLTPRKPASRLR